MLFCTRTCLLVSDILLLRSFLRFFQVWFERIGCNIPWNLWALQTEHRSSLSWANRSQWTSPLCPDSLSPFALLAVRKGRSVLRKPFHSKESQARSRCRKWFLLQQCCKLVSKFRTWGVMSYQNATCLLRWRTLDGDCLAGSSWCTLTTEPNKVNCFPFF